MNSFYTQIIIILTLYLSQSVNAGILSWDGVDDIKFGTTPDSSFVSDPDSIFSSEHCQFMINKNYPSVRFMVENGIITRADLPLDYQTDIGINTNQTIKDMRENFPAISLEPHKYLTNGHYIYFYNKQKTKAIVIEYYKGKAQSLRAGKLPAVGYVEGCG